MTLKNNYLILLLVLIAGCKQMPQITVPSLPGVSAYKIDIQQGNVISQEMLDKLQPGMTRNQVRFVLGTPLLVDPFRTDRWDYVYTMNKKGDRIEQRQLKVFFQDDKMVRYEGDIVAEAKPGATPVAAAKAAAKPIEKPAVKPVATPVAKPEPSQSAPAAPAVSVPAPSPEIAKPAMPSTPAPEAAADVGKPQLQMAPGPGEPAKPEDLKPPVVATPREPESLDAPPLPRLILPPEQTEPASTFAATPEVPAKPVTAPVAAKPEIKPTEKPPAGPGFFGRMFGSSPKPEQPSASAVAKPDAPVKPVITPAPVASTPDVIPKPAAAPVAVTPEPRPVEKPPAAPGLFGRLLGGSPKPAQPGAEAAAKPDLPVKPAVTPEPAPAVAPAPAPVEKPVTAKPEVKPVAKPVAVKDKPADKPSTERGFFGRIYEGMRNPAPPVRSPGDAREALPGSPPPPFVDPDPSAAKP